MGVERRLLRERLAQLKSDTSTAREALARELIEVANEREVQQALLKQEKHEAHAYVALRDSLAQQEKHEADDSAALRDSLAQQALLEERVVALEATLIQEQSARKKLEAHTEADAAESKEAVADILRRLRVLGSCPAVPASAEAGDVAGILVDCRQALTCAEDASKKVKAAQTKGQQGGCFLM